MWRGRPASVAWILALALGAMGCSGLAALDGEGSSLSADERNTVRGKADQALAARSYKAAWAQEVAAGADRTRLEHIALEALRNQSGNAEEMFAALRDKWGDLSPDARARVSALVEQAQRGDAWERAVELEILAADDPPTFERAWAVYEAAPYDRAAGLLEAIQDARTEHAESAESGD